MDLLKPYFSTRVLIHTGSKKHFMLVLAPSKDITSSLCPTQEKKATAFHVRCSGLPHPKHTDLVSVPFLFPSAANFHCSPAKPLKNPQLCIQAQSQKFELCSIKLLHLTTLLELKKIINFYWISLYTAASLMNPHKS